MMNDLFDEEESMYKDQTQQSWHDPLWLQVSLLNEETCLDYFKNSIFYDDKENLQYKAQRVNIPPAHDIGFRVTKIVNEPNTNTQKVISTYFIVDGIIFQAATLKAVIEERLERASF